MKIVIRGKYSAKELNLQCDATKFLTRVGRWDWLTPRQAKRIENYFGEEATKFDKAFLEILYQ